MNKNVKIIVFLGAFLLLTLLTVFSSVLQEFNYYNVPIHAQNKIALKIEFEDSIHASPGLITMSMADVRDSIVFSEDTYKLSNLPNQKVIFGFVSDSIPKYFILHVSKTGDPHTFIKSMEMLFNGQKIELPLNNFVRNKELLDDGLSVSLFKDSKGEKYKYMVPVLYFHKIKLEEIVLLLSITMLISYLLTIAIDSYLNNDFPNRIHRDEFLIYLLSVSLLFNEHWSSKVLIIIGLFIVYDLWIKRRKIRVLQFGSFILLFIYSSITLIWSIDKTNSLILLGRLFPLVLLSIWLSQPLNNFDFKKVFRYVALTYILFALFSVFLATLRYNTTLNFEEFYYHTLLEPFGGANAIYIALLYAMVLLINMSTLRYEISDIDSFLIIMLLFMYIALLSSKMISFALIISTIVLLGAKVRNKLGGMKRMLGMLSVVLIMIVLVLSSSKKLQSRYLDILDLKGAKEALYNENFGPVYPWNGLSLRIFQLRCFWEIEKNSEFNSILGVGVNNGQPLLDERYDFYELYKGKSSDKRGGFYVYNFHNQYIQTLIETGLGGFLFLIFVLFQLFSFAIRKKNYLMFAVFLMLLTIMFSESLLLRSKGIISFVFFPMVVFQIDLILARKK